MIFEKQIEQFKKQQIKMHQVTKFFKRSQAGNDRETLSAINIYPRIDVKGKSHLGVEIECRGQRVYITFKDLDFMINSLEHIKEVFTGKTFEELEDRIRAIETAKKL